MYEADPIMVNSKIMRDRHQELIQRVQRESLTHDLKNAQGNRKIAALLQIILAIINLIMRS